MVMKFGCHMNASLEKGTHFQIYVHTGASACCIEEEVWYSAVEQVVAQGEYGLGESHHSIKVCQSC